MFLFGAGTDALDGGVCGGAVDLRRGGYQAGDFFAVAHMFARFDQVVSNIGLSWGLRHWLGRSLLFQGL